MSLPFRPISVRILNQEEQAEMLGYLGITLEALPICLLNDAMWRWITPEGEQLAPGRVVRIERENNGNYPYTFRVLR